MSKSTNELLPRLLLRGEFVKWWLLRNRSFTMKDAHEFEAAWDRFINGKVVISRDKL